MPLYQHQASAVKRRSGHQGQSAEDDTHGRAYQDDYINARCACQQALRDIL